jgi:hypothetical protein
MASESWLISNRNKTAINNIIIEQAIQNILNNQHDYFHQLIDSLSPYQKKVIQALASETDQIFSHDYMKKYDLGAVSSTQRAVISLVNAGILEREGEHIYFSNPFLRIYIQNRMMK